MKSVWCFFFIVFIKFCFCDQFYDLVQEEWKSYKIEYGKSYSGPIEEKYRFKIFMANMKEIHQHNQRYEYGAETYKKGVNQFTDMFDFEVENTVCGLNGTQLEKDWEYDESAVNFIRPENIQVPNEVNWVTKGAVTEVKDQGKCRADWAFSATGTLEGQHFLLTKKLVSLSAQNLIDCSRPFGTKGCHFGIPKLALNYLKNNTGIDTEESYPYTGKDDQSCMYDTKNVGATCKGYAKVKRYNEILLRDAVATIGPISVGIQTTKNFYNYKGGIFYDSTCIKKTNKVNHSALIVGYGKDDKTNEEYWLVKNSWGTKWGENGYIKMIRNKDNNCNIAAFPVYALV